MKNKIVLNITEEGRGGGALGRIHIVAKAIKKNFETIVIYPDDAKEYEQILKRQEVKHEGIMLHPLTKDPIGLLKYMFFFFIEIFILIRVIKKYNPVLIQTNGCWQIKGVIAGKLTKTKVFWYLNDSYQPNIILRLFKTLSWMSFSYGFAAIRSKSYYQDISPRIKKKHSYVISSPVDIDAIKYRERRRNNDEAIRVLTVGYINVHKGIELIIETAKILSHFKIEFHIVGPVLDSQRRYKLALDQKIESLRLENIKFLGFKTISSNLLSEYDMYLCSSLREASPMAVWEALASGLPVVSTNVGDVKDVLENYNCGFICDNFSGTSISNRIIEFMQLSEQEYIIMSKQARLAAEHYFSIEKVAKGYLRCYSEIINANTDYCD